MATFRSNESLVKPLNETKPDENDRAVRLFAVLVGAVGHKTYGRLIRASLSSCREIEFESSWAEEFDGKLESAIATVVRKMSWKFGPLRVPVPGLPRVRQDYALSYLAMCNARRAVRRHKADVVHFNTQCVARLAIGLAREIPVTISLDRTANQLSCSPSWPSYEPNLADRKTKAKMQQVRPGKSAFRFNWDEWSDAAMFEAAAALFPWSRWTANSLTNHYGVHTEKVHVIYPGAEMERLVVADRSPGRRTSRCNLLFMGNDFARKGGPDLAEVFLSSLSDKCELHLVTNAKISYSHPNIHVYKDVVAYSEEWYSLYDQADIFVLPTYDEAFGLAVVEAMGSGLPVVASNINAIPEMISEGVNGLLVDAGDRASLSHALTSLANDPALRWRMGQVNREKAELLFDSTKNFRKMGAKVVELVGRRSTGT